MNEKRKSEFSTYNSLSKGTDDAISTAELGIEFVHFDAENNPERIQTIPFNNFIKDTTLSSEEYFMTRSLIASQANK